MPKISPQLQPYWQTTDHQTVKLYLGDVIETLKQLPPKSVQCVATSPPYWGLRDYGTATWEGGNPTCTHDSGKMEKRTRETYNDAGNYTPAFIDKVERGTAQIGTKCKKCGAKRIDSQLGSEPLHDCNGWARGENCGKCHVCKMRLVFAEVHRVLRDDGTLWLNYGDTYSSGQSLPSKNLCGVPWRVALGLQADGWILRQDIIFAKKAPMPESVTDRCTKSHEQLFLFSKQPQYFYDAEAIKSKAVTAPHTCGNSKLDVSRNDHDRINEVWAKDGTTNKRDVWWVEPSLDEMAAQFLVWMSERADWEKIKQEFQSQLANKSDVWLLGTYAYAGAHYATFNPELVRPCIKAGTSEMGCCSKCHAPYKRATTKTRLKRNRPNEYVKRTGAKGTGNSCANTTAGVKVETTGWEKTCQCKNAGVVPCVVLDPFAGSGTTCAVAIEEGRWSVGIELSQTYLDQNAIPRVSAKLYSLLTHRNLVPRAPVEAVDAGLDLDFDSEPF